MQTANSILAHIKGQIDIEWDEAPRKTYNGQPTTKRTAEKE